MPAGDLYNVVAVEEASSHRTQRRMDFTLNSRCPSMPGKDTPNITVVNSNLYGTRIKFYSPVSEFHYLVLSPLHAVYRSGSRLSQCNAMPLQLRIISHTLDVGGAGMIRKKNGPCRCRHHVSRACVDFIVAGAGSSGFVSRNLWSPAISGPPRPFVPAIFGPPWSLTAPPAHAYQEPAFFPRTGNVKRLIDAIDQASYLFILLAVTAINL